MCIVPWARVWQAPKLFVVEYCRHSSTSKGIFKFSWTPSWRCLLNTFLAMSRLWGAHAPNSLSSLLLYGVRLNSHSIWSSPQALGWLVESGWGSIQFWVFYPYLPKDLKNKSLMTRVPQPPSLESKSPRFWNKGSKESWHAICDGKDLMVKMGKLVQ
jgi:hypothetical protein